MQKLPPDLIPRANKLLMPYMGNEDERTAWLAQAFFLREDSRVHHQINPSGSAMVFTTNCVTQLLKFGCFTDGTHALAQLLQTIRHFSGAQTHAEIDALCRQLNDICGTVQPAKTVTQQPPTPPITPSQNINTPATKRSPTVFISYSHRDDAIVQRLMGDLNAAGHACWVDITGIKGGDEWMRSICEGINNSYAFVIVCTVKALQSRWVRDEILWARQKNKFIVPAILEEAVIGDDNFFGLHTYQGVKLYEGYEAALHQLLDVLPAASIVDGDDQNEAVTVTKLERKVSQRELELEYLDRLRFEELLNTEKYTALAGQSLVSKESDAPNRSESVVMRPEFIHTPWSKTNEMQRETRRFENAVDEIMAIKRAVVLGEPGAGKTTTLWKLARNLVDTAINDPKAPIPLVVRLGKWTNETQSLPDFIASQLGGLGVHLSTLLQERAVLLLDGLNEIPVAQRKIKDEQVRQFIYNYPDLMAIVTCREQDYTLDLGFDRIEIAPLNPIQIREFVDRYLGEATGIILFWKLAGEKASDYWQQFGKATELSETERENYFWLQQKPLEKAERGWSEEHAWAWRRWLNLRDHPSSLMVLAKNPYMLFMLTDVYTATGDLPDNRGQLFRDFVETLFVRESIASRDKQTLAVKLSNEAQALFNALCELAFEMQVQRSQQEDGNAVTALSLSYVRRFLTNERLEYLAASTSILSVGEEVRFTHQLLQEYFAAMALQQRIFESDSPLKASDIWESDKWWERTNWEESMVLLAGLYSDDCTFVLDWIEAANPEVAVQCILKSGAHTPDTTLIRFRDKWIPRLTDFKNDPDPRARAALGRALGQLKLGGKLMDNRRGVSVREESLPDIQWGKELLAGRYKIGGDANAYDQMEVQEVQVIHSYKLAQYPVTMAQLQAFIDTPDGMQSDRWWDEILTDKELYQQRNKYQNHPRDNVTWYQAVAFCRWLTAKYHESGLLDEKWEIRLPSEKEWEVAARYPDGRLFPWGNKDEVNSANMRETGIGQTSAVGIFSSGRQTELDLYDLSGNVWEWTLTRADGSNEIDASDRSCVIRGGSFIYDIRFARAGSRRFYAPHGRMYFFGFRLCASPVGIVL